MEEWNDKEWSEVESSIRESIPDRDQRGIQWTAFWTHDAPVFYQKLIHNPFGFEWTYHGVVTVKGVLREQRFVVRQTQLVPTLQYPMLFELAPGGRWPKTLHDTLLHRMWILPVQRHDAIHEPCYLMEGNNIQWVFQLIVALCVGNHDPLRAEKPRTTDSL
jgi:hypothetical protein